MSVSCFIHINAIAFSLFNKSDAETNSETPSVFNSNYSNAVTPVFNPDYSELIGRSDLAYRKNYNRHPGNAGGERKVWRACLAEQRQYACLCS